MPTVVKAAVVTLGCRIEKERHENAKVIVAFVELSFQEGDGHEAAGINPRCFRWLGHSCYPWWLAGLLCCGSVC